MDKIIVKGVRQHNLKNISIEIPKNKLVVFTGVSGSGKSSLAFDTIYAEGQRRYVESLSSYARQFLGVMGKPDVDSIEGLSPAISIDQKSTSHNPRSTVGTVTEIYDYLRLLFARAGHPHCPNCGREISSMDKSQIVATLLKSIENHFIENPGKKPLRLLILSPLVRDRKGEFSALLENLGRKGYQSVRIDGKIIPTSKNLLLIKTNKHSIEAVIDRISLDKKQFKDPVSYANLKSRLNEAVEQALDLSEGLIITSKVLDASFDFPESPINMKDTLFSQKLACPNCGISLPEIEPRVFSFNSPHGACPNCKGLGKILKIDPHLVFNKNLTISEGGILPFAKQFYHDTWFSRVVLTVAKEIGVDPRQQLADMAPEQEKVLLFGTGGKLHFVEGTNRFGEMTHIEEEYPGIIGELERKYHETTSDFVKMEIEKYMRAETCPVCNGARLKKEALSITIGSQSIVDISNLAVSRAFEWINNLGSNILESDREKIIAEPIIKEVRKRLNFLNSLGLDYLTLSRDATTLAGGEAQRIRLASQIGSGLSGVLYVLDEPSIGLHPRDNDKLIKSLKDLRDLGNTVVVVEHDREMMENADYIFDFGPGGGKNGGVLIASSTASEIKNNPRSLTGQYLSGKKDILREKTLLNGETKTNKLLTITGCQQFNLKKIDVSFPLGKLVAVTGVSGSGKSTLVVETLYRALKCYFNPFYKEKPGAFTDLKGVEYLNAVHLIDQSPIGRTPRSNPATYVGAFTHVRDLFSQMPESKIRGYQPGRFSFNVKGGRCENCEGEGEEKIEMQFLPPVWVKCEVCKGKRYNAATLEVTYKGKNISEILEMTISEAADFFRHIPSIAQKMETLNAVGLDYLQVGQSAPTLSGGEAQRVKLASELSKRGQGGNIYILDEPTTGLHFADLEKLLKVLHDLVAQNNTVIVIEHNLEIIKNADHIIDLGPEGGDGGGKIVVCGTVKQVMSTPQSYTGQFLRKLK